MLTGLTVSVITLAQHSLPVGGETKRFLMRLQQSVLVERAGRGKMSVFNNETN